MFYGLPLKSRESKIVKCTVKRVMMLFKTEAIVKRDIEEK
jgi:hypothetical protein